MRLLGFIISVAIFLLLNPTGLVAQPTATWVSRAPGSTYRIGQKSELKLVGTTNVNSFQCDCEHSFPAQLFRIEKHEDGVHTTHFSDTRLSIPIASLDCGNRVMNKDLQKALNADRHPNISIELLQVAEDKCSRLRQMGDWVKVKALASISLNGFSRNYWLDITATNTAPGRYRFIGTKALRMSDFNVEPPTAMMGMVKVDDQIKISLDLEIIVE